MNGDVSTVEVLPTLYSGLFWVIIAGILGITIVSTMYFWGAGKHGKAIEMITASENRRTLAIVCALLAITLLGLVKVLDGDDVTTLLALVVGIVSGGALIKTNKPAP